MWTAIGGLGALFQAVSNAVAMLKSWLDRRAAAQHDDEVRAETRSQGALGQVQLQKEIDDAADAARPADDDVSRRLSDGTY